MEFLRPVVTEKEMKPCANSACRTPIRFDDDRELCNYCVTMGYRRHFLILTGKLRQKHCGECGYVLVPIRQPSGRYDFICPDWQKKHAKPVHLGNVTFVVLERRKERDLKRAVNLLIPAEGIATVGQCRTCKGPLTRKTRRAWKKKYDYQVHYCEVDICTPCNKVYIIPSSKKNPGQPCNCYRK